MTFIRKFLDYSIFAGFLLLAFLLVFDPYLEVPVGVQWFGQLHPVVLHFPIVLILLTIFQYWRKDPAFGWYLNITTLLSIVTSITGFLLRKGEGSEGDLIMTHQWLGVSVTFLLLIWYWINQNLRIRQQWIITLNGALLVLILATGHYGGMVTHGRDFLSFAPKNDGSPRIPENPVVYEHFIQPILDSKCISCHNPDKTKGELILTGFPALLAGGESGSAIDPSAPGKSLLLKRISLPVEDEEHMPPEEETQLSREEMTLLTEWVLNGASPERTFEELDPGSLVYELVKKQIDRRKEYKWQDLPDISDDELEGLSSDYIRIFRMFHQSDALQVIVYPNDQYSTGIWSDLRPVTGNIVELNLSGLPLGDAEMDFIIECENLEKLNLSNSPLTDEKIRSIASHGKLREVIVYNTQITDEALTELSGMPALSRLYVYNTAISEEGLNAFIETREGVQVVSTADQARDFSSVLPPPEAVPQVYFFRKPFRMRLEHPLSGIDVFYTMDGSVPDETSARVQDSLLIQQSTFLKFFAAKEGWVSSQVDSLRMFRTIEPPDGMTLENEPNQRFRGRGLASLFGLEKAPDNFQDSAWMAFRQNDLILNCEWREPIEIGNVVLSSLVDTGPYLFPPESIIVRGGMEKSRMKTLSELYPEKLQERSGRYFSFYECQIERDSIRFLEIRVRPLQDIPLWHPGKGEKGWFFIDEVVLE